MSSNKIGEDDENGQGQFASPPCFMHELDPAYGMPDARALASEQQMTDDERLDAVIHRIDQLNAADPNLEMNEGRSEPAALLYGQRMSAILAEFASASSEHLKIAVRGQHIERWKRPRSDYPEGRTGYLQWRREAAKYHAERVAELMKSEGYDDDACARTASLIRKERFKIDREAQQLEDVAALVFMRWYFAPFAPGRPQEELFQIVKKTAIKMSTEGRKAALKLPLPAALVPAILAAD